MRKISILAAFFVLAFNQIKAQNLKGDPWIFQVYQEMYHRQPNAWELNINNYNSGSWNNYNELKAYVKEFQENLQRNSINIGFVKIDDNKLKVGFTTNNQLAGTAVISTNGGGVITSGGANVITSGGANVITIGCCNFQLTQNTRAVGFGGKYTTQSAGKTVVAASGKAALIFQ